MILRRVEPAAAADTRRRGGTGYFGGGTGYAGAPWGFRAPDRPASGSSMKSGSVLAARAAVRVCRGVSAMNGDRSGGDCEVPAEVTGNGSESQLPASRPICDFRPIISDIGRTCVPNLSEAPDCTTPTGATPAAVTPCCRTTNHDPEFSSRASSRASLRPVTENASSSKSSGRHHCWVSSPLVGWPLRYSASRQIRRIR